MKTKYFFFILLFQTAFFFAQSQNIDDILGRGEADSPAQHGEVVMAIDYDIPKGGGKDEASESAEKMNAKWKKYLLERILEIQTIYDRLLEIDSSAITKETIEEFTAQAELVKEKFDFKLSNDPLWKDNDELDDLRAKFLDVHTRTVKKLKYLEENFGKGKEPVNKLYLIGGIVAGFMVLMPIVSQIRAIVSSRKAKKEAKKLLLQQKMEAEKQMLLADETNIIKLN